MFKTDYDEFAALLDAVYALHGKALPAAAKAIFFRAMAKYPLDVVRAALDAQVCDPQRGQYTPKPADLIAQIEGMQANDGRLGADEAWARALSGLDESETIVTTPEIMEAFGVARAVLDGGDEVGARMAFKDAYNRLVGVARANGRPAEWTVSLGWDAEKRQEPLRKAVEAGLLPAPTVAALLPAPVEVEPKSLSAAEGLARVRAALAKLVPASERMRRAQEQRNQQRRERTEQAKRDADAMVRDYEAEDA